MTPAAYNAMLSEFRTVFPSRNKKEQSGILADLASMCTLVRRPSGKPYKKPRVMFLRGCMESERSPVEDAVATTSVVFVDAPSRTCKYSAELRGFADFRDIADKHPEDYAAFCVSAGVAPDKIVPTESIAAMDSYWCTIFPDRARTAWYRNWKKSEGPPHLRLYPGGPIPRNLDFNTPKRAMLAWLKETQTVRTFTGLADYRLFADVWTPEHDAAGVNYSRFHKEPQNSIWLRPKTIRMIKDWVSVSIPRSISFDNIMLYVYCNGTYLHYMKYGSITRAIRYVNMASSVGTTYKSVEVEVDISLRYNGVVVE